MYKTLSTFLTITIFAIPTLQVISAEIDTGQRSTAAVKAEIDSLPPVGKGLELVKPYQVEVPVLGQRAPDQRGAYSRQHLQTPLSREIVPPGYRYGSPGYMPDGRGGRGYDYGYPGYRDQGGGGYPHHRGW